jgi:hypothetical protein
VAKKIKRVVADKTYLDLLIRKADLLDALFVGNDGAAVGAAVVTVESLKEWAAIERAWDKAGGCSDLVEPYEEPAGK